MIPVGFPENIAQPFHLLGPRHSVTFFLFFLDLRGLGLLDFLGGMTEVELPQILFDVMVGIAQNGTFLGLSWRWLHVLSYD